MLDLFKGGHKNRCKAQQKRAYFVDTCLTNSVQINQAHTKIKHANTKVPDVYACPPCMAKIASKLVIKLLIQVGQLGAVCKSVSGQGS